jgi:TPR repeat protein
MDIFKRKLCHSLLISSGLIMGYALNGHAAQINLPVTSATNASQLVKQNPNPTYLLSMANRLQSSTYAFENQGLIIYLLKQAAKQGSAEAQFQLGNLYLEGELLEQDEDKAIHWLSKAVAQNHSPAQFVYDHFMNGGFDIGC